MLIQDLWGGGGSPVGVRGEADSRPVGVGLGPQ